MFVNNLNAAQQGKMLSLAQLIIAVDGRVVAKEQAMIDFLRSQCVENVTVESVDFSKLPSLFDNQQAKVSLLLELIGIAYADEDYHESEKGIVREVSMVLGVSSPLLEDMENWVKKQFIQVKEAQAFMED